MIHENSAAAYYEGTEELNERELICYAALVELGRATDRAVLEFLYGSNERNMNLVRPRITELLLDCWVEEVTTARDHVTDCKVRVCRALTAQERLYAKAAEERRRHLLAAALAGAEPQQVVPTAAAFRDAWLTRDEEAFNRLTTALELQETRS